MLLQIAVFSVAAQECYHQQGYKANEEQQEFHFLGASTLAWPRGVEESMGQATEHWTGE